MDVSGNVKDIKLIQTNQYLRTISSPRRATVRIQVKKNKGIKLQKYMLKVFLLVTSRQYKHRILIDTDKLESKRRSGTINPCCHKNLNFLIPPTKHLKSLRLDV